jgi:glutamate/tyrosine decarboxylase-like PLP-dependent enzyme
MMRRIDESDDFEAEPTDPQLSVVCFRHLVDGLDGEALDRHQDDLQRALERSGAGWVSTTKLHGRTYLRAGIVNYQTTTGDIDALLATLRHLSTLSD